MLAYPSPQSHCCHSPMALSAKPEDPCRNKTVGTLKFWNVFELAKIELAAGGCRRQANVGLVNTARQGFGGMYPGISVDSSSRCRRLRGNVDCGER